mmetsp:Transcript_7047/g.14149  ORF Transcript_7047/g.14149 Transcript_7047/m.14149 type:complete len:336 (-) Transcript_7047:227-1234(-)
MLSRTIASRVLRSGALRALSSSSAGKAPEVAKAAVEAKSTQEEKPATNEPKIADTKIDSRIAEPEANAVKSASDKVQEDQNQAVDSEKIEKQQSQGEDKNGDKKEGDDDVKSEKQVRHEELMGKLRAWMETSLLVQLRRVYEKPDLKLFEADEHLILREQAEQIPPLRLQALTGQPISVPSINKVTLLLVSFNQLGFEMLPSWREPVERHLHANVLQHRQRNKRSLQVVSVSVVENRFYQSLSSVLGKAFERTVDSRHMDSTAGFYDDFSAWKPALGVKNRIIGYAFLIDPQGLVRWRGCAEATFQESMNLIRCLNDLLEEKPPTTLPHKPPPAA